MLKRSKFRRLEAYGAFVVAMIAIIIYAAGALDAFDLYVQDVLYNKARPVNTQIILIGIDDRSLEQVGPWPWPRGEMAKMVGQIAKGQPKAIGLDILFSEEGDETHLLAKEIADAKVVVLPVVGQFDKRSQKSKTQLEGEESVYALKARNVLLPVPELAKGATLAHINVLQDYADGIVRRIEPFIANGERLYPSFAQALWRVGTGKNQTPIDSQKHAPLISFVGKSGSFGVISAADLLTEKIPPEYFKEAYVLIGPTAIGILEDRYTTGIDRQFPMSGLEIHANILQSLLDYTSEKKTFVEEGSLYIDIAILLALMSMVWIVSARFPLTIGVLSTLVLVVLYGVSAIWVNGKGLRLVLLYPALGVVLMFLWIQAIRFIETSFEKRRIRHLFSQYVAPEVVSEILAMNDAALLLESHRRDVTVLFVDIRGFTPLSEHTSPEVVVKVLNAYLTLTSESIFAQRGTVDKFIGDATMAVFNAPLDLPGHAMAAVRAAMAMRAKAAELAGDLKARYGVDLSFGIGIHTGPAIVGNIGSDHRLDYTAIGDTVNTAARLESKASPGEILVSEEMVKATEGYVHCTYVGEIALKGKQNPVPVYRVDEEIKKPI